MSARVLCLIIRSDPRKSHRPAEAVRIALGLGGSDHPIRILLADEAVRILTEEAESCVEAEALERYLGTLSEWKTPFYIERGHALAGEVDRERFNVREVNGKEQADLLASGERVLVL
ncbi:MAG: hypothetical protein HZA23_07905 [Nitrospirae bacterium]|nr:hypothetical protein [Nitrospirota bacterium]